MPAQPLMMVCVQLFSADATDDRLLAIWEGRKSDVRRSSFAFTPGTVLFARNLAVNETPASRHAVQGIGVAAPIRLHISDILQAAPSHSFGAQALEFTRWHQVEVEAQRIIHPHVSFTSSVKVTLWPASTSMRGKARFGSGSNDLGLALNAG